MICPLFPQPYFAKVGKTDLKTLFKKLFLKRIDKFKGNQTATSLCFIEELVAPKSTTFLLTRAECTIASHTQ